MNTNTSVTKRIAPTAFALAIITAASVATGGGLDNNPQSAGEAAPRNSAGLTLDGAMGNPALVGLERPPRGGLSLFPFSAALWSDKLAMPLDLNALANPTDPSRAAAYYVTKFMRRSFDLKEGLSPEEVSEKLTRELRGGLGAHAGMKSSPIVFATRGFGLSAGTFVNADAILPGQLFLPFFSGTDGLLYGKSLDLSDLRLSAIWASEIAVKLGYSTAIPFLRDHIGLDKGAAGVGIKLLLGHAYFNAEMAEGSAISYDSASNKYKADARLNALSAGTGFHGNFRYKNDYLINNPINGQGWGFDIGTVFHNDAHALSVDVQDIGLIMWNGKEVRKSAMAFKTEFDLSDLYLGMDGLFDFDADTLAPDNKNYLLWLPAALNVGYSYTLRLDGGLSALLGYLTASAGYNQLLASGVGRDAYRPRFSAGAALGLLAGCLPVRYGVIFGGPQKLASAVGAGLNAKYFSVDAFYKAVGNPALRPTRGFEAGGGLTFHWGWKRKDKVKDAPEAEEPEAAPADTAPEPYVPEAQEFFPGEAEPDTVYEPVEVIAAAPQQPQPPQPEPAPQPAPAPQPTPEETRALAASQRAINFVPGGATLTESSYAPLNAIAELLAQYPHIRYEVQGHTDSHGAEMYNLLLSAERAAVVKYYLILRGAPESSLVAVGYGKNIPIADNGTVVGRAMNRRVEFVPIQSQEHYDWVKRFELDMIPRLTHRIINGRIIIEPKGAGE